MNLTHVQEDLLRTVVGVWNDDCHGQFIVSRSFTGSDLLYGRKHHPNVPITADDSDFERLAAEDLIDLGHTPGGSLRGKPTAKGIALVAADFVEPEPTAPASIRINSAGGHVQFAVGDHAHQEQHVNDVEVLRSALEAGITGLSKNLEHLLTGSDRDEALAELAAVREAAQSDEIDRPSVMQRIERVARPVYAMLAFAATADAGAKALKKLQQVVGTLVDPEPPMWIDEWAGVLAIALGVVVVALVFYVLRCREAERERAYWQDAYRNTDQHRRAVEEYCGKLQKARRGEYSSSREKLEELASCETLVVRYNEPRATLAFKEAESMASAMGSEA